MMYIISEKKNTLERVKIGYMEQKLEKAIWKTKQKKTPSKAAK